jgi:hypothetical protein
LFSAARLQGNSAQPGRFTGLIMLGTELSSQMTIAGPEADGLRQGGATHCKQSPQVRALLRFVAPIAPLSLRIHVSSPAQVTLTYREVYLQACVQLSSASSLLNSFLHSDSATLHIPECSLCPSLYDPRFPGPRSSRGFPRDQVPFPVAVLSPSSHRPGFPSPWKPLTRYQCVELLFEPSNLRS